MATRIPHCQTDERGIHRHRPRIVPGDDLVENIVVQSSNLGVSHDGTTHVELLLATLTHPAQEWSRTAPGTPATIPPAQLQPADYGREMSAAGLNLQASRIAVSLRQNRSRGSQHRVATLLGTPELLAMVLWKSSAETLPKWQGRSCGAFKASKLPRTNSSSFRCLTPLEPSNMKVARAGSHLDTDRQHID